VQASACGAPFRDLDEARGQQAAEGPCDRGGCYVDTDAEVELLTLVEGAQEECNARAA